MTWKELPLKSNSRYLSLSLYFPWVKLIISLLNFGKLNCVTPLICNPSFSSSIVLFFNCSTISIYSLYEFLYKSNNFVLISSMDCLFSSIFLLRLSISDNNFPSISIDSSRVLICFLTSSFCWYSFSFSSILDFSLLICFSSSLKRKLFKLYFIIK